LGYFNANGVVIAKAVVDPRMIRNDPSISFIKTGTLVFKGARKF